jgi:trehalose 6-phosphate synthase
LARLVIVSNRVVSPRDKAARAGGVAVALRETLAKRGGLWFGWSGQVVEAAAGAPHVARAGKITVATVDLAAEDYQAFYLGYANGMLWPIFHYRPGMFRFQRGALEGYLRVNRDCAKHLAALLQPDDVIWVHDYHFIPLAAELRRLGFANRIGFFLHIPFPVPELLVALPGYRRLLGDLTAYDVVGLQTESDVRGLLRGYAEEMTGVAVAEGRVEAAGRHTAVAAFPIGIATDEFAILAEKAAGGAETQRLRDSLSGRSLVIGVDRLDYSKGLTNRFEAFQELLTQHPEHRAKVTFLQIAPISRGEVAQYRSLRRELESLAGRINGKYAAFDWTPVRYLNTSFRRDVLAGFYRVARVGLVTPTRDGMNLVAKEFVAAQAPDDPGVLVLSRFAGAASELGAALIVNPYDVDELSATLHAALTMPLDERRSRWSRMMAALRANTIATWKERCLADVEAGA